MFRCQSLAVLSCLSIGVFCGCRPSAPVNSGPGSAKQTDPYFASEPGPRDPDAATEFTTTESGLKYRILRKSTGPNAQAPNQVVVNYRGWLEDESRPFDQSYGKVPFPVQLSPIGQPAGVIPGWNEGLTYVGEGGMIELEIPSDLAYGPDGMPPDIPPNATLHFIVEVLEVR